MILGHLIRFVMLPIFKYNRISIRLLSFVGCSIVARKPADQSVNKQDILAAAASVLQRNGYEATTMKDIAAGVNLTAASLYHHFKNKDALLLAVLEYGLSQALEQITPIVDSSLTAVEKLRAMIHAHINGITEHPAIGAAMVFEIRTLMTIPDKSLDAEYRARREAFFKMRDSFEQMFRRVLEAGIQNGEFRAVDVAVVTRAMLGAHNWVGVWYKPDGRLRGEQIAAIMAETFVLSLQPQPVSTSQH